MGQFALVLHATEALQPPYKLCHSVWGDDEVKSRPGYEYVVAVQKTCFSVFAQVECFLDLINYSVNVHRLSRGFDGTGAGMMIGSIEAVSKVRDLLNAPWIAQPKILFPRLGPRRQ
jgi:hypothetical protein